MMIKEKMEYDYFIPLRDDNGKIVSILDTRYGDNTKIDTIEEVIDILNEQYRIIKQWSKSSGKISKLLKENTKPTTTDGGRDVYLDIDFETKRCRYEKTLICNKCAYYSTYFLDCRLMMEDKQYQKALKLGLVKKDD